MKRLICCVSLLLMMFVSCVEICIPNKRNIRYAIKHNDIECLDANALKTLITSDTTKYKIVIFYSTCCGPCVRHFEETYHTAYAKHNDSINFYFIHNNTGGIQLSREHLERYGMYDGKVLCFLDLENADFHYDNIQYLNNISNHVFKSGPKINGNFGTPCEFIVNKDNKVLKQHTTTPTSGSAITTMALWQIEIDKINEIDFDSIYQNDLDFDLFDNLQICIDEFCPME